MKTIAMTVNIASDGRAVGSNGRSKSDRAMKYPRTTPSAAKKNASRRMMYINEPHTNRNGVLENLSNALVMLSINPFTLFFPTGANYINDAIVF
jgi:hypothetical protein